MESERSTSQESSPSFVQHLIRRELRKALSAAAMEKVAEWVAAMNPCPCGYAGDPLRTCNCGTHQVQRYRGRISGPILDRIDLHIEVPAVRYEDLCTTQPAESSTAIGERVSAARAVQLARYSEDRIYCNAHMKFKHIRKHCN